MLKVLGGLLRFLLFLVALSAMLVICGGAGWYVLDQGTTSKVGGVSDGPGGGSPVQVSGSTLEDTLIGVYLSFRQAELAQPASDSDVLITFTIETGETASTVAARLEEMGLITDSNLFSLYMRYHKIDSRLEAGDYDLSPSMTMIEIAENLQHARVDEIVVTVPEGWRAEQIAEMLTQNEIVAGEEFMALARDGGDFHHEFLGERSDSHTALEGFLFPETYRISTKATAADLIKRMLNTFDRRFTPVMRQEAASKGMTAYQVVTLASIVEREAVISEERPIIASVYLNRLAAGMLLNADPTVQYALGYQPNSGLWWKTPISLEEYSLVDSPYNTYLYGGLPPGPICNPGLSSIRAVVRPAQTDYLYFVGKGDGSHIFARTYEEHIRNQEQLQP
jgi:UPF0755 protein